MDKQILWAEATLLIALMDGSDWRINRALEIIDGLHYRVLTQD